MDEATKLEAVDLKVIDLDFDALEKWTDPEKDNLPIYSCISLYFACGMQAAIQGYSDTHDNVQIVALDNLCCNFFTLQRLKRLISHSWQVYSLKCTADNEVSWDTDKWAKGQKHYARKLRGKEERALNLDFANYCPGIDDDLPDGQLVLRIFNRVPKTENDS